MIVTTTVRKTTVVPEKVVLKRKRIKLLLMNFI